MEKILLRGEVEFFETVAVGSEDQIGSISRVEESCPWSNCFFG